MKNLTFIYTLIITAFLSCCKEPADNTLNNHKMEDTLFKTFPTVNRLTVEVKDNEEVLITLGDKELFNASEEERIAATNKIGQITIGIYSEGNWLKKGSVTYVENESQLDVKNDVKKTYDMKIEQLQHSIGK